MKTILLLSVVLLAGCATVPQTEIRFNPKTGEVVILSPKNVTADSLEVIKSGSNVTFRAKKLTSENDAEILRTIADANAATLSRSVKVIEGLTKAAADGAAPGP